MENKAYFVDYFEPKPTSFQPGVPDCKNRAVIPTMVVETKEGIKNLFNCLVHVANINTTLYIDDKSRIIVVYAGPVEVRSYDYQNNPLGLRKQTLYDFDNNIAIYYDAVGEYRIYDLRSEL